jgi:hypothetical protein
LGQGVEPGDLVGEGVGAGGRMALGLAAQRLARRLPPLVGGLGLAAGKPGGVAGGEDAG